MANYGPSKHIVAFVDALGFAKEIYKKDFERDDRHDRIDAFFSVIWDKKDKSRWKRIKKASVGDSLIFAIKLDKRSKYINDLSLLVEFLSVIQRELALQDIWTRGSIACGVLHFSKQWIIGPAFHRAYILEAKTAKYPRIIVDGNIIKDAGFNSVSEIKNHSNLKLYKYDNDPKNETQLIAQDVPTFVDFAAPTYIDSNSDIDFYSKLASHLSNRFKENVEHFEKYKWLSNYFYEQAMKIRNNNKTNAKLLDAINVFKNC